MSTRSLLSSLLLLTCACAGTDQSGSSGGASAAAPTTVAAQIEHGKAVYTKTCARCHGPAGQGSDKAPAVVGAGALPLDPPEGRKVRKVQFRTALDVAQFVVANMPPGPGAKVGGADAWAVLAFDLSANGVKLEQPVGPDNAGAIVLH